MILRIVSSFGELDGLQLTSVLTGSPKRSIVFGAGSDGDFDEEFLKTGLAEKLVRSEFSVFALVGPNAEKHHDDLDWIAEDWIAESRDQTAIITSMHDEDDADDIATFLSCYFSGDGSSELYAVLTPGNQSDERLRLELLKYTQ